MSQENVEIVRRGLDAWISGDLDALFALFDPTVEWDMSHFRDWPELTYYGPEGVQRFLTEWLDVWDDYRMGLTRVVAGPDGRVLSLLRHHGRGRDSGAPMDIAMANVATLRDSRIIRIENYSDPAEALEAVGLRE